MSEWARIEDGGQITLPAAYLRALGWNVGDEVILQLEDGELRLFTLQQAIKRAQEIVSRYVPEGVSLADELIRERHAEAGRA